MIEFKYSESLHERVFQKASGYDAFYKEARRLKNQKVQTYIVMSRTPREERLSCNGYRQDRWPGVMVSDREVFRRLPIILLNELELTPHNLAFKLFASHMEQRRKVFRKFQEKVGWLGSAFEKMLSGLYLLWFEEDGMSTNQLTSKKIMEMGEIFGKRYLELLPPEERLKGIPDDVRVKGIPDDVRLKGIPVEDRLVGLSDKEIIEFLKKMNKRYKVV
jgi:hypothetical protein